MKRLARLLTGTPTTSDRWVIVGLGNPGPQYRQTRHNVGFQVIERFLSDSVCTSSRNKFHAEVFQVERGTGESWLLVRPQTYMNESGTTVAALVNYYRLELAQLMVVCDDFNLPLGRLRFRREGSHGGQKGLRDIIEKLGTDAFPRLRVGIAAPDGNAIDHVLGTFAPDEVPVVNDALERAVTGLRVWRSDSLEEAMNRCNAAS